VTLTPDVSVSMTATGAVRLEQTTAFVTGITKNGTTAPRTVGTADSVAYDATGAATVTGLDVDTTLTAAFDLLGNTGLTASAELDLGGSLTVDDELAPTQICASLDATETLGWEASWSQWSTGWSDETTPDQEIALGEDQACQDPDPTLDPGPAPDVVSGELPSGKVDATYAAELQVADGRDGTWSLAGGTLPPGLVLGADGSLTGTPTAVGGFRFQARFTDQQGLQGTGAYLVAIGAEDGLGGGAVQATLTWSGPADFDLHAVEPDGNEIYFGNPGPSAGGGALDWDANADCRSVAVAPAENIRWNGDATPSGTYTFLLGTYKVCGATDLSWHLTVRVDGEVVAEETGTSSGVEFSEAQVYALDYHAPEGAAGAAQDPIWRLTKVRK
jgi:hypothetical protein